MGKRYEVHAFAADDIDDAAELLAARHQRQRAAWPALNPAFEDAAIVQSLLTGLLWDETASGWSVAVEGRTSAYLIGARKPEVPWGQNVWVGDFANAGDDPEAIRHVYATAAAAWAADGRVQHYVTVPSTDAATVEAWFSLSFGLQHVYAFREPAAADFQPWTGNGLTIRPAENSDIPALLELDPVLPTHSGQSPVFSPVPIPPREESAAEIEQDLSDNRFQSFVAERGGHVIATATAVSLDMSNSWSPLMRPVSCGFLGFAAVLPHARGLGAGRALADAVLAWSRDQGFEWVATDWRSTNLEANRTWRAAGFRPAFYRLHRAIG
ncbi:MAG TPA: GNAT family N-acetyltransferase [Candidatus Limnocylindrales bacterium]|nr:GNAT family N-acetyltransferase [Candidatus Limnocylindrales bacterium]